jgi:glycosyltransferase involved in cell wall biosynthesis
VDVDSFSICEAKEDFYLAASRLVPYKRIDLIVEAFADMPEKRLVVIGDGPDMAKIQSKASKNIEILGYQSTETLRSYLQRAKAFVFAAEEDFGIMPVEAQACGTPVIAFGRGGVTETVCGLDRELPTGVFFDQQTPNSIREAIEIFEGQKIDPASCRKNAERFSTQTFVNRFHSFVMNHCCEQQ